MQELTAEELRRLHEEAKDLLVINVLAPADYDEAHIPGSVNVPLDRERFSDEVLFRSGSKDAPVVVYCASATCTASPRAAEKLEQAGFRRVSVFRGGVKAWREAGLSIETGRPRR